jgi:hypothetical protein
VSELKELGLITSADAEEIIIDGFDLRDGSFVLEVDTQEEFLRAQGFAEQAQQQTFGENQRRSPNRFEVRRE